MRASSSTLVDVCFVLAVIGGVLAIRRWVGWLYTFAPSDHVLSALYVAHALVLGIAACLVRRDLESGAIALISGGFLVVGIAWLVGEVGWYSLRPKHRLVLDQRATRVNIGEELSRVPTGRGMAWLAAALPGNELYQLRFVETTLTVPLLPRALDGLSILHLTDPHFRDPPGADFFAAAVARVADRPVDLVALTGDLVDDLENAAAVRGALAPLKASIGRYFILGNHDTEDPVARRRLLEDDGWISVGGRWTTASCRETTFLIGGNERPWLGEAPEPPEGAPGGFRLLLSHSPYQFHWASRRNIGLLLAGHLHGGQIVLPGGFCPNGAPYRQGVFIRDRTVMSVSACVGQVTPLRFGCPPEISRLVLRAPDAPIDNSRNPT